MLLSLICSFVKLHLKWLVWLLYLGQYQGSWIASASCSAVMPWRTVSDQEVMPHVEQFGVFLVLDISKMCCFFFSTVYFDSCIYQGKFYIVGAWLHEVMASLIKFRTESACFMMVCEPLFELVHHENCVTSGKNLEMKKYISSQSWKAQKFSSFFPISGLCTSLAFCFSSAVLSPNIR